jgi:response regulator RpfG family c-di-GMP phosphodiesterase
MKQVYDVLVIDDDPEFREDCRALLQGDFEIQSADDTNFKQFVEQTPYDLVLLDIMMPQQSGEDILRQIRALDKRCAVVVVTNDPHHETVPRFESQRVPVLPKGDRGFAAAIRRQLGLYSFKDPADLSALIVDDEEQQQLDLRDMLQSVGIRDIVWAQSLEDADTLASQRHFDIYLVDMCYRDQMGRQMIQGPAFVWRLFEIAENRQASIILPLTSKGEGRAHFDKLPRDGAVKPLYYDSNQRIRETLTRIIQRGPFRIPL